MRSARLGVVALLLLASPVAQAEEQVVSSAVLAPGQSGSPEAPAQPASTEGAVAKPETPAETPAETGGTLPMSLALDLAKELAVPPLPPPITLTLKVDLSGQRVTVMERGEVKYVWAISSGRSGYATQTGTFQPQWTSRMWYSRQWDMAPMPHAVFFNRGTAFHATIATGMLGRPASHGCIRLAPGNAAKLYSLVHRHGLASTKVVVHGAPQGPAVAQRKNNRQYAQQGSVYAVGGYQARPASQRTSRRPPSPSLWGF